MRSRSFWGVILIAIGLLALLVELEILVGDLAALWPAILIILGAWFLIRGILSAGARGVTAGLVALAAGTVLLGEKLNWFQEGLLFPVLLVALGAGVLLRSLLGAESPAG